MSNSCWFVVCTMQFGVCDDECHSNLGKKTQQNNKMKNNFIGVTLKYDTKNVYKRLKQ